MSSNSYESQLSPSLISHLLAEYHLKVLEPIGQGLNCEVYRAIKINRQRYQYALKVYTFKREGNDNKEERLKMQYEIQVKVLRIFEKERGIIKIYEYGMYEDFGFVVLELMKGGSMRDLSNNMFRQLPRENEQQGRSQNEKVSLEIQRKSHVEIEKMTKNLLAQLILILQKLQDYGVIHRDIKLQNVMLDNKLNLKLIDFGTVHLVQSRFQQKFEKNQYERILELNQKLNSKSDFLVGTKHYICPQMISGKRNRIISNKMDIWSFGVIAYRMFCGRYPFQMTGCKKNSEYFHKICNQQPHFPSFLTKDQIQLLNSCLSKNPASRPTAKQVQRLAYFNDISCQQLNAINETEQNLMSVNFSNPNNERMKPIFQLTNENVKYYKNKHKKKQNYEPVSSYTNLPEIQNENPMENIYKKIKKYKNVDICIEENEKQERILKIITKSDLGRIKLVSMWANDLKVEKINEKQIKMERKNEGNNEKTDEFQLKFQHFEQAEDFISALIKVDDRI